MSKISLPIPSPLPLSQNPTHHTLHLQQANQKAVPHQHRTPVDISVSTLAFKPEHEPPQPTPNDQARNPAEMEGRTPKVNKNKNSTSPIETDEAWTRTIAAERAEDRTRALAAISADFERRRAAANPPRAINAPEHPLLQNVARPTSEAATVDFRETRPLHVEPSTATPALEAFGQQLRMLVGLPPPGGRDRRAMREWESTGREELARLARELERQGREQGSGYGRGFEAWVRAALREEREEGEESVDAVQEDAWGRSGRCRE